MVSGHTEGRTVNSKENTTLLPYTPDDGDDDRRAGCVEVAHRELDDDEIEAIRRGARDRIIEEGGDGFRWGRRTFGIPSTKLAGVLSREPQITEYAHEQVQGLDPGTRTVVFEERVELTSGDDGLLSIDIVTFEDSNRVETITVETLGGVTWAGSPR